PARPDAAPQLALDGLAEAVAAEVVALERRTDLLDPGSFQSGDDQRAVGGAASRGVGHRGQSARPARHPWRRPRRQTARPVLPLQQLFAAPVAGNQRSPASGAIVWTTLPAASRNSMAP